MVHLSFSSINFPLILPHFASTSYGHTSQWTSFHSNQLNSPIITIHTYTIFKKWDNPASFLFILVFSNKQYNFLQQINVKKCPSSIQCRDSNPWPFEHELSPKTTRPRLPPCHTIILQFFMLLGNKFSWLQVAKYWKIIYLAVWSHWSTIKFCLLDQQVSFQK